MEPVSKSLAALAAPVAVIVMLPLASMAKKPSALVFELVAVNTKLVTATSSLAATVATVAPLAWFSA